MTGKAEIRNWYERTEYNDIRLWELYFALLVLLNIVILPTVIASDGLGLLFASLVVVLAFDVLLTFAFRKIYRVVKRRGF